MKQKILVADDDTKFLNDLVRDLKAEGFDARGVGSGRETLEEIRTWKADLVLLDLIMPMKNGFETLREKRSDKTISSIPVIMVSQSNDPKNIDLALTLGVRDYVAKSNLDMSELVAKIRLQLGAPDESPNMDTPSHREKLASLSGYKVMWVEDDTYLSDIISRKLSSQGCTLVHAKTGEEALEFVKKSKPDVIMLDILLPGINGFEVLEKIKSDPDLKDIPVILTSNLGQRSDVEKGEKLGAEKFLVKATVTLDEIIEETKKVLARVKK